MQTDKQPEVSAVFLQTLIDAILDLRNRLQQEYERAYPGLGNAIRIVVDEERFKFRAVRIAREQIVFVRDKRSEERRVGKECA